MRLDLKAQLVRQGLWGLWDRKDHRGIPGPAGVAGQRGPAGPAGGSLGASSYQCIQGQPISAGAPILFTSFIVDDPEIGTSGTEFNSIVLQPGLYQIQFVWGLDWRGFTPTPPAGVQVTINGGAVPNGIVGPPGISEAWIPNSIPVSWNLPFLTQITAPNATLQVVALPITQAPTVGGSCDLIITQLQ